jgi:hypothetical protein
MGVIGFIVQKPDLAIFVLGSGLIARSGLQHTDFEWIGILAYLNGQAERM